MGRKRRTSAIAALRTPPITWKVPLVRWMALPFTRRAQPLAWRSLVAGAILGVTACGVGDPGDDGPAALGQDSDLAGATFEHDNVVVDLWADGMAAFGIFVPNERPRTDEQRRSGERPAPVYTKEGGGRLAQNPLYDFLFLNLEGSYDVAAVRAIAEGLHGPSAVARKALLVRIPPIERAGEEVTRARVKEILELGADGVVFPHVRSPEEARIGNRSR